jgi:hypothetical protein
MAFLLGLFDTVLPGTGLFLVFQTLLILGALLALVWLNPRPGWWTPVIALVIVATPQWLLFQGEIWKDMLFADAAIAGFAALAWAEARWHPGIIALAAALLVVAAMVRQPGLILLPVAARAVALIARRHGRSGWRWGGGFLAATLLLASGLTLALALRGDRGDGAQAQIRVAQAYDLAGAYARAPDLRLPLADHDPRLDRLLHTRGAALYTPLRNDPMSGDPAISDAISAAPDGALGASWRALILGHPLLYGQVRAAAFAAVIRTPDSFACHFSPVGIDGDPGVLATLGIAPRIRPQDRALANYAHLFFTTPVYSHLFWGGAALILLLVLRRRGAIAMTGLLTGALLLALTFVIVSLACDYRYLVFLDLAALAAALSFSRQCDEAGKQPRAAGLPPHPGAGL